MLIGVWGRLQSSAMAENSRGDKGAAGTLSLSRSTSSMRKYYMKSAPLANPPISGSTNFLHRATKDLRDL